MKTKLTKLFIVNAAVCLMFNCLVPTICRGMLNLPDTGQINDYTVTVGEDSDYSINEPSYTDNGNGTISDNITGLMWQQTDGGEMTWENALSYAESLTLASYDDWRLPTSHELFSIVNHQTSNPALDTAYFTDSDAEYWWTSNQKVDEADRVWVINAGGGIGPHPKNETISAGGAKRFHVLCVRDDSGAGGSEHDFTANGDGTITDENTGLMWQQAGDGTAVAWEEALEYAESLTLGEHDDWRLPNIKELRSISDDDLANSSFDTNYFTGYSSGYWSSTTEQNHPEEAWNVDFSYGLISHTIKTTALNVRCVRGGAEQQNSGVTEPGAELVLIGSGYEFTEGPAVDDRGNIYFSDINTSIIYIWRPDDTFLTHLTNTGGANGLFLDADGNLIACQGDNGRVVSIDPSGAVTALADQYNGLAFNKPNDLWIAPDGGIYFSDPAYGVSLVQDGEHVYYISPDGAGVIRVIDDMVRPNGIIGTPDGSLLYVTDHGADETYVYEINTDGTLTNKSLFASTGGDGMTIDSESNIYLAVTEGIVVFDSTGNQIEMIEVPDEEPTNVSFCGPDDKTLFITARSAVYRIAMNVEGVRGGGNGGGDGGISIKQAISDEAQKKTIAFDGLAFLTGDMCSDTFFPPGKVSDFFGFQYRRDITPNGYGHNTEFAGKVADNVLGILTDDQVQILVALANEQIDMVDDYAYKRFVLIKAFRRLWENDLPDGATGLDKSAVMELSADLYEIDAEISYDRADVLGGIVYTMSVDQKGALEQLETDLDALFEAAGAGGAINWPSPASQPDLSGLNDNEGRVLVSTFATQLYSWYLGSSYGDTYFCPERHGTYFGSFYMKDIPPILSTEAVTIDTNLTADMGQAFLDALDDVQLDLIMGLLDIQRPILDNIVDKRQEISEKLRPLMAGVSVDKDETLELIRQYGEYDGEIVYNYATNFVSVSNRMTIDQGDTLTGLRLGYYELFPDYQADSSVYDCSGAWVYSNAINEMPEIENTDFLFGNCSIDGDVSGDCTVDLTDFARLAQNWLDIDCGLCNGADLSEDGNIDMADLTVLAENWLSGL